MSLVLADQPAAKMTFARILRSLPAGKPLPQNVWASRHRGIVILLWAHIPALVVIGVAAGRPVIHTVGEVSAVIPFAFAAMRTTSRRRLATAMSSIGLLTCSAMLVHFTEGTIEMHFHYFVMIGVVTLYQDWVPFLLAIGYVVGQHGVGGALVPASVYNHPGAIRNPWVWALVHGGFILAMSATGLLMWKLNETLVDTVEMRERALAAAEADRARLIGEVLDAGERERVRVATELHDGPIQHLARVGYAVDRAVMRLRRTDVEGAVDVLATVRDALTEEVNGLRALMSELRPPALDEGGLSSALSDYGAAFAKRTGIDCLVDAELDEAMLPSQIETIAYRVMQEALVNVERHSGASRVRVGISVDDGRRLELRVADDGSGFDTSLMRQFVRDEHFGLAGMQERVRCGSGTWSVTSAPGLGTTILVLLPIEAPVVGVLAQAG